jgi:hypothetical protein
MSAARLMRLSGASLLTGGLLASAGFLLSAWFDPTNTGYQEWYWFPLNFAIIIGGFFIILGLPGFYAAQSRESGIIGFAGHVVLFAGIAFAYLAVHSIQTTTMPDTPPGMRLIVSYAAPSLLIGSLLTAVAVWRADVYARWLAVLLVVAVLLGLVSAFVPDLAWGWRNVVSSVFTMTIAMFGVNVIVTAPRFAHLARR